MAERMPQQKIERDESVYLTRSNPPGSKEKMIDAAARSAYNNNRTYEGCSRCVLMGVNEHFKMVEDKDSFDACIKASTAMAAGVARMGETCGALTGAIMALGLEFGSANMRAFDKYVDTMSLSKELFLKFREIYGTVNCIEIQNKVLGRKYDFTIEADRDAWYSEGGLDRCPRVCATAAALAAEIILENRK